MPRKLRVLYVCAVYHVINRRDQGESIFKKEEDRGRFLRRLGDVSDGDGGERADAGCSQDTRR